MCARDVLQLGQDVSHRFGVYSVSTGAPRRMFVLLIDSLRYQTATNPAFMLNYVVDDLDGMLERLHAAGADVDPKREDHDYGRFAWVTDPEGNRIELWEPAK